MATFTLTTKGGTSTWVHTVTYTTSATDDKFTFTVTKITCKFTDTNSSVTHYIPTSPIRFYKNIDSAYMSVPISTAQIKNGSTGTLFSGTKSVTWSKAHSATYVAYDATNGEFIVTIPAKTKYTVSYNANSGSGAPGSQTKWYGETLTLSSTKPTRTGYNFQGWATTSSGSVTYSSGANYTANKAVTLYAVWKIKTYKVTYNANSGSGAPAAQTKTYGTTLKLSTTKPTRTGYTFKGWATSASGSVAYSPGDNYTANAALALYAVWQINTYKVTYNANGGSGAPAAQTKTYGVTLQLSSTKPTRAKYTFKGWATSASGAVAYSSGGNYTANASVTLYAVWELTFISPTITNLTATRSSGSAGEYIEDEEGTIAHIKFNWVAGSYGSDKVLASSCKIGIREYKTGSYTYVTVNPVATPVSSTTYLINYYFDSYVIDIDKQYDIQVQLIVNSSTTVIKTTYITAAYFIFDINADGTALGFGVVAPDNKGGLFSAMPMFLVKGPSGFYLIDKNKNYYAGIYDSGNNMLIGYGIRDSSESSSFHHSGGTFISSGHNGTTGNKSAYIAIPNDSQYGAKGNYHILHMGYTPDIIDTIPDIILEESTNVTIANAQFAKWGKIAQVRLEFTNKAAITVGSIGGITNVKIGQFISGKRPAVGTAASSNGDGAGPCWFSISTAGTVNLTSAVATGASRTIAAGSTFTMYATYILP